MRRSEAPPGQAGPLKLETRELSKRYQIAVLERVDLAVRAGEFVCLLGPNGCGKTTLFRIPAELERPDAGSVFVDGRPVDLTVPTSTRSGRWPRRHTPPAGRAQRARSAGGVLAPRRRGTILPDERMEDREQ